MHVASRFRSAQKRLRERHKKLCLAFNRESLSNYVFRCGEQGHVKAECMMWKIKMCTNSKCLIASECSYAHTSNELRTPWTPKCIRITKRDGNLMVLGCGSLKHTFRNCPKQF